LFLSELSEGEADHRETQNASVVELIRLMYAEEKLSLFVLEPDETARNVFNFKPDYMQA
jgi:hypothetical protein